MSKKELTSMDKKIGFQSESIMDENLMEKISKKIYKNF